MPDQQPAGLRVDIVSDVVCPWCIIGFKQLERALIETGVTAQIFWHPFELNPQMGPEGQDLQQHVAEKYGSTPEQSAAARQRLTEMGATLGFPFKYSDTHRMVNTFRAHQLIQWAGGQGKGHQVKMALFSAFFTDQRNVDDTGVLVDIALQTGLDGSAAKVMLDAEGLGSAIREEEEFWTSHGIQGVPAMIFNQEHLVTGAQGVETYSRILRQMAGLPSGKAQA